MKHIIITLIILLTVAGFMVYKALEALFNIAILVGNIEKEVNYQLDIFHMKRVLLTKLPL